MNRNNIAKLLIGAAAFASAMPLMAETETVGGIEWNYTVSDGGFYGIILRIKGRIECHD